VTVTVYEPAEPEQDRVEVPEPVTLVGDSVHVRPVLGETLDVSETVPAKPSSAVTVIVDVPATPAFTVTLVVLALIVKSWIVYVTVAEWDRVPLVPVTVTV
jgi:hypothetical protein